jgi:hypothetical protein
LNGQVLGLVLGNGLKQNWTVAGQCSLVFFTWGAKSGTRQSAGKVLKLDGEVLWLVMN